ncbi:hypothetical protein SDRG_14504 [Saprolegnia diclina VS20]|uniref:Vacuolar protein 8 n=1 Tax=Saprolegnia diclina (strain VS20) TaxID=1156394 RepID=T0Q2X1_SAPDV|nr:hypothetical protein SDRG_14504 [Saprolegnia diclina VS20]EQC27755.1 hypothetical protein SDRG_14504 [Saprolegnia diclina VS20]|eukprot:XP_008618860.1 hypothetical protein SDRG_14504 [Saprolegnia diclina VS20]
MGQIASAQGAPEAPRPTSWDDVDELQTQPIDIPHFLWRAEVEAGYWKHLEAAQIQPIRFLGQRLTVKQIRGSADTTKPPLPPLAPDMSPGAAFLAMPQLMDEHWIYPLCALITNSDARTAEMAMAALSSIIDSGKRQEMAVDARAIPSLLSHLPPLKANWSAAQFAVHAPLQRTAFDVLTALCHDNRAVALNLIELQVVERIVDVCSAPTPTLVLEERKASALQTLLELLKQDELKRELASTPVVGMLVVLVSNTHASIAFHALASLSELFLCAPAREAAIAAGVIPLLLTCLVSATLPHSNKTLILQATYALSILATHVADAFPLDDSVTAICHVMEILRGALKRSRLASLVCMFITGLSWRVPACHRFQVALRDRPSPNLFAILASLLIGGSNDVICAASIAVAALSRQSPESVHSFVKLDVHVTLTKLLAAKDTRVATSSAMALHRFLQPYQLELVLGGRIRPAPWQTEMTQLMHSMGAMDVLLTTILAPPTSTQPADKPPASAYEIQSTLALFGYAQNKAVWGATATVHRMLLYMHAADNELLLELLLHVQLCTAPDLTASPRPFCDLFVSHGGTEIVLPLLTPKTAPKYLVAGLAIWLHLALAYYRDASPLVPAHIETMLQASLGLCAHVQDVFVLAATIRVLEVLSEPKCCLAETTLATILRGDAHRVTNLLFVHKEEIQYKAGLVVGRLVRAGNGVYLPLQSACAQLLVLLESPSHDVAFAASHAWGNLLVLPSPLVCFGGQAPSAVASVLRLFSVQTQPKHLRDASRTLYRASKSHEVQGELLRSGMSILEGLVRHALDVVGHHTMLTLTEMGKTPMYRPSVLSPSVLLLFQDLFLSLPETPVVPPARLLQNKLDALYFVAHVCVDAASQHTVLVAGLVDHTMALVLTPSPDEVSALKLAALTALATLCSADDATRDHILIEPIVAAVLRLLDPPEMAHLELLTQCLTIVLHLLDAPRAQLLIGKSPLVGNIVQTLQVLDNNVRSLACQVLAKLAFRCDGVKADMSRMDALNILLNLVCLESLGSRVQRDALHALGTLVGTASPASKTNKQELFDLPQSIQLTKMLSRPDGAHAAALETAALVLAVLANATYHSPRNQRLLQTLEMPVVALTDVFFDAPSSLTEPIAVQALRVLANLTSHAENRRNMARDPALFRALLRALQSDVAQLHRFSALAMAHLATGSDDHRILMGSFGGLLPALAERLNAKHPLVLENVCFAITKLGAHGGNQIIFGANLVFERLLPLAVHNDVAVQKMAVNAIAVLIDGNEKNKVSLVECNAIPILCGLVNQLDSVHSRVLECAMQTLSGLVAAQVIEVSKYLDPRVVIRLLSSVNAKLQRTSLTLLASLTKESFNKVRYGEKDCMEAVVQCLNSHLSTGTSDRVENDATSLLDSEADLMLVELAATSLANLSFEPLNTTAIIEANGTVSCVQRLGELIDAALVLSFESSPQKPNKRQSPKKPATQHGSSSNNNNHDDDEQSRAYVADETPTKVAIPLLITRPMQCAHILEQCALILNNCAHAILAGRYVTEDLVGTVTMMLGHASDLVKKCACFTLTIWCSKVELHQGYVMNQPGVLTTLIGLLNSSNAGILEAALWVLTKLSGYRDNHIQMANCDIVRILEALIFRFHTSIGSGVLDRAIRLLGNLALHDPIRGLVKCEGLVAGPLHSILEHQLQPHPAPVIEAGPILHCKNIARLMGILLGEDALKLFFPKKTLGLLKRIYIADSTLVKVRRNIILVFFLLSGIEEHRFGIASGEKDSVVPKLVQALALDEHELFVRANILAMFSLWSQHEGLCHLLYLCEIAETLLKYMVVTEFEADHYAAIIVHHLSSLKEQVRKRLAMEGTTELALSLLKQCLETPIPNDPFAFSCAGILANLTVHDDAKAIVVHVGGLPTLLTYLGLKIDDVVHGGPNAILDSLAKVLANLSFDDACKVEMLRLHTIPLVLQVLQRRLANFVGVENYVLCLGNLSTVHGAIGQLEVASAIPTLFSHLEAHQTSSPWVAKCVIWTISNMTMHSTKSKYQVLEYPTGLLLVLSLLNTETSKQTDTIIECTMTCLSCLATEPPIAAGLAACATIPLILRYLEPDVRQSLQRKAVKTINSLATFGFADYMEDLSHTHTRLLSIASEGHQSIAPTAMAALRRISHLRNESPQVLCEHVNGIDALLQLLQSESTSTVLDALHLLHHIAVETAPILRNAQYFATRQSCTLATTLLGDDCSTEMGDAVVRFAAFLIQNSQFDTGMAASDEDWPLVLTRLSRWWDGLDAFETHELTPSLLAAVDSFMRDKTFIGKHYGPTILSASSLQRIASSLLKLLKGHIDPVLHGTRALVHLACASLHYQKTLFEVGFARQLSHVLLAAPETTCPDVLWLVLLQGILLYTHDIVAREMYMEISTADALLRLLFHSNLVVAARALEIVHLLVAQPLGQRAFRAAEAIMHLTTKLRSEEDTTNQVRLVQSLVLLWDEAETTVRAFVTAETVPLLMGPCLVRHSTDTLILLHCLSLSARFHASLFCFAESFLDRLRSRTQWTSSDTVLVLRILVNFCWAVDSYMLRMVDCGLLRTLLPVAQWVWAPFNSEARASTVPEATWEKEVEFVLKLLARITYDPALRLTFVDGAEIPDILALLKPPLRHGNDWDDLGLLENGAETIANLAMVKDIQIILIVEDGVTYMAQLLLLLPAKHTRLTRRLVRAIHNLSYDLEVQAILAAQQTFPYFIQHIASLSGLPLLPPPDATSLDVNASHHVAAMAVCIVHDISNTVQWVDGLVEMGAQRGLAALLHHKALGAWSDAAIDLESLVLETLGNLSHTAFVETLVTDGVALHFGQFVVSYLGVLALTPPGPRKQLQFGWALHGLSTLCVRSASARQQLATNAKCILDVAHWLVALHEAPLPNQMDAVALLSSLCRVESSRNALAPKVPPSLLDRTVDVALHADATEAGQAAALALLAHLLGPDVDVVDQNGWSFAFADTLSSSVLLHDAIGRQRSEACYTNGLQLLHGCLRHTKLLTHKVPTTMYLLVLAALHASPTPTLDFRYALGILEIAVEHIESRRQLVETQALDALLLGLADAPTSLSLPALQEVLRKLLLEAMEVYVERDPALVAIVASVLTAIPNPLLVDTALAFLGHLALAGGVLAGAVIASVQAEMRLLQLLSRHVEQVHATTCSRASVNVARFISYEDMLRVYLFAMTFRRHASDRPLTPGSLWMTDRNIASCFIMDLLYWFSSQQHTVTRHFGSMYPDLILATPLLVQMAYPKEASHAPLPGVHYFDHVQEDILHELLVIITASPFGDTIAQACIYALIEMHAWWGAESLLVALLQALPAKTELLMKLSALLEPAPTPTLRFLMLLVTTDALVDDLKAVGVKENLESLEVPDEADQSMRSALLNLLGYSVDLSLAFVADLQRFAACLRDPLERTQLMAGMQTTLAMHVVTEPDVLAQALPLLVRELTRDVAFLNDVVHCLVHFVSFECFPDYCVDPSTVLRAYLERFHSFSPKSHDALMDILVSLHDAGVPADAFGFFALDSKDGFEPLPSLLRLAADLLGANIAAASRMLHFAWLQAMHETHVVVLLAQHASLLTPFCVLLHQLPPVPKPGAKRGPRHAGWTPSQIAQFDVVQMIQSMAALTWAPSSLCEATSLFMRLIDVLGTFPVQTAPKVQALQTQYLSDISKIVHRLSIFVADDTFDLDDGFKRLVGYLDVSPKPGPVQLALYQLVANVSKLPSVVLSLHRLQCLETLVHRFPKVHLDYQLYVLAALANAAQTGLESEIVSRLAIEANAVHALLRGLQTYTREPQAHAAFLLSALLLHYPDVGGSIECVTTLIECLEAVDMIVVQHVLVALSAILHVEPTQETLLRHATVPVLAQILQKSDYVCTEHVLRILAVLCSQHAAICRRVVASNLLGILLSTVRNVAEIESRPHDVFHAAWVLSCLTKDKDLAGRIDDFDGTFFAFLHGSLAHFTLKTLSKLLRMLSHVWGYVLPVTRELVSPYVKALLTILPRCDNTTLVKNGVHVLCILFLHPSLEDEPELIEALAQSFFSYLHDANSKLVVYCLRALTAGVVAEALPEHLIRAHFDVQANVLHVLHLLVPEAYNGGEHNRLLCVLQFLNAISTDESTLPMLTPLAVPPLWHVLESSPLESFNDCTIKETLLLLSTLTRVASPVLSLTPLLVAALKQLLLLLDQDDAPSCVYYADGLHVLINLTAVAELAQSLVLHGALNLLLDMFVGGDETHVPLVLLGIASLSSDALAQQTVDFTPILAKLMHLVVSSPPTVQATCVWVVSNIASLDAVRRQLNAQNGASVLQSLLNEVTNPALSATNSRPVSSSKRIRDHAPKALKDLGFTPLNPR